MSILLGSEMAANKWVAPSFGGDFRSSSQEIPPLSKRRRITKEETKPFKFTGSRVSSCKVKTDLPWLDMFAPRKKQDLVVHKKKIEQVEIWLLEKFSSIEKKLNTRCPILLLTGPSGCGKTATIKVLAKEHNIDIREWEESNKLVDEWKYDGPEMLNQSTVFSNFLLRSSRYNSLFNEKNIAKRILLIEDIPNFFYKCKSSLHDILRKYQKNAMCPVIFILSDTGSEVSHELNVFPKDFQAELNISVINFNPATTLSICKALLYILSEVSNQTGLVVPNKSELELLAESSKGDIRSAINSLQIFKSAPTTHTNKDSLLLRKNDNIVAKNLSLDLFHSIGKILYCKRDQNKSEPKLSKHLKEQQRFPLLENPEDVFQRTAISSERFNLFLHENYLDFVIGIERMSICAHGFSDSDILLHEWSTRDYLNPFSSSIAIRSVMFNLNLPNDKKVNKLRPFKKPQWFENKKLSNSQQNYVHSEFENSHLALGNDLETLLIPYLALIRPHGLSSNQMSLAMNMSNFKNQSKSNFQNQDKHLKFSAQPFKQGTEFTHISNDKDAVDDYKEFVIEEFE